MQPCRSRILSLVSATSTYPSVLARVALILQALDVGQLFGSCKHHSSEISCALVNACNTLLHVNRSIDDCVV